MAARAPPPLSAPARRGFQGFSLECVLARCGAGGRYGRCAAEPKLRPCRGLGAAVLSVGDPAGAARPGPARPGTASHPQNSAGAAQRGGGSGSPWGSERAFSCERGGGSLGNPARAGVGSGG